MPNPYGRNRSSVRMTTPEIVVKIRTRRPIEGISSVLLPFRADGSIDFDSFAENLLRTADVGLTPAVNVEFGCLERLSAAERAEVLDLARDVLVARPFVAGATIEDPGGNVRYQYRLAASEIVQNGGTPIIMPSSALSCLEDSGWLGLFQSLVDDANTVIAFEADPQVIASGKIYSAETIREVMQYPHVAGLRHSSMNRRLEWERLSLRDEVRPDFKIYSGNDIALDMVIYGSDYFLSVSACAPEAFALRDLHWKNGDPRFFELNDLLQSLGMLAFRPPSVAARHSAMQMLRLRGRIECDAPARGEPSRPDSDLEILIKIIERLDQLLHAGHVHL